MNVFTQLSRRFRTDNANANYAAPSLTNPMTFIAGTVPERMLGHSFKPLRADQVGVLTTVTPGRGETPGQFALQGMVPVTTGRVI